MTASATRSSDHQTAADVPVEASPLGDAVTDGDGTGVGEIVDVTVGDVVGLGDGDGLGFGDLLGDVLGDGLGVCVGELVGFSVGASVGDASGVSAKPSVSGCGMASARAKAVRRRAFEKG